MIYITGDTHRDFRRFNVHNFPEQREMTKDDYVIICGDFGGIWDQGQESPEEKYNLDWFESRSYTLLFVDGNHENFDRLYEYPVKEWHGGKVHEIRPHVLHLMRGQVFDIDGITFFTFGGASSHDISGGILDMDAPDFRKRKKHLNDIGAFYRVNHVSWWAQELAAEAEMEEGRRNLAAHNNTVDFIVTHCCSTSSQMLIGGAKFQPDRVTDYLEEIKGTVTFKKWFFGHYHDDRNLYGQEILLFTQIIRIA